MLPMHSAPRTEQLVDMPLTHLRASPDDNTGDQALERRDRQGFPLAVLLCKAGS
jgi:hypothetical protein